MNLIIKVPTDDKGWSEFNSKFAKLQKELVLLSIKKLNINYDDRENILHGIIDKIKESQIDSK